MRKFVVLLIIGILLANAVVFIGNVRATSSTIYSTPDNCDDARIQIGFSANHGTTAELDVANDDTGNYERSYIRFNDLSSIPAGSVISSATLHIWAWSVSLTDRPDPVVKCYRVTSSWSESTISGTLYPTYDSALLSSNTYHNSGTEPDYWQWSSFDITGAFATWIGNPSINYGVVLKTDDGSTNEWVFYTSSDGDVSYRPYLSIEYTYTPTNSVPSLSSQSVSPTTGDSTTTFGYSVTYSDADNDAPTTRSIYVDGAAHTMTTTDTTYTDGSVFTYSTTLIDGSHTYYFQFDDGNGHVVRSPTSGTYSGPTVSTFVPGAPTLTSPTNAAAVTDPTPTFMWGSISGAILYHIQIDDANTFASVVDEVQTASTEYTPTTSLDAGTYYWRVCASSGSTWGGWSSIWSLYVAKILPVPYQYQGATGWCWANSISMGLQYYGHHVHPWDLAAFVGAGHDTGYDPAFHPDFLTYCQNTYGLSLNLITTSFQSFTSKLDAGYPIFVGSLNNHHYLLIVGYSIEGSNSYVYVNNPSNAWVSGTYPIIQKKILYSTMFGGIDIFMSWSLESDIPSSVPSGSMSLIDNGIQESNPDPSGSGDFNFLWLDRGLKYKNTYLYPGIISNGIPFSHSSDVLLMVSAFNQNEVSQNYQMNIQVFKGLETTGTSHQQSIQFGLSGKNAGQVSFSIDLSNAFFSQDGWYNLNIGLWRQNPNYNVDRPYDLINDIYFYVSDLPYNPNIVIANCPVNITLIDEYGNRVGVYDNGTYVNDIPLDAHYTTVNDTKFIVLPTDRNFRVEVYGNDTGVYTLSSTRYDNGTTRSIEFSNVSVFTDSIDTYAFNKTLEEFSLTTSDPKPSLDILFQLANGTYNTTFTLTSVAISQNVAYNFTHIDWENILANAGNICTFSFDSDSDGIPDGTLNVTTATTGSDIYNTVIGTSIDPEPEPEPESSTNETDTNDNETNETDEPEPESDDPVLLASTEMLIAIIAIIIIALISVAVAVRKAGRRQHYEHTEIASYSNWEHSCASCGRITTNDNALCTDCLRNYEK